MEDGFPWDPQVPSMGGVMDLYPPMRGILTSKSIDHILPALQAIRSKVGGVSKDGHNPHHKSSFPTYNSVCDAIAGPCAEQGVVWSHATEPLIVGSKCMLVIYTYFIHVDSQEFWGQGIPVEPPMDNFHKMGAMESFFQRRGIIGLLALKQVDDDANSAMGITTKPAPQRAASNSSEMCNATSQDRLMVLAGEAAERAGVNLATVWQKCTGGYEPARIRASSFNKAVAAITAFGKPKTDELAARLGGE